ncbi:hypothetical protein D9M68_833280 [compost metagenome]
MDQVLVDLGEALVHLRRVDHDVAVGLADGLDGLRDRAVQRALPEGLLEVVLGGQAPRGVHHLARRQPGQHPAQALQRQGRVPHQLVSADKRSAVDERSVDGVIKAAQHAESSCGPAATFPFKPCSPSRAGLGDGCLCGILLATLLPAKG